MLELRLSSFSRAVVAVAMAKETGTLVKNDATSKETSLSPTSIGTWKQV